MGQNVGACCSTRDREDDVQGIARDGGNSACSQPKGNGLTLSGFVTANPGKIKDFYDIHGHMGEGTYGSVKQAIKKDTKSQRAIKTISKGKLKGNKAQQGAKMKMFQKEVAIMSVLDHPHIVRLYETFEDAQCYHLVMEVCRGGELFDHIIKAQYFTEVQAAHCMEQIVKGVNYMHKVSICHRDLKPENFLCLSKDPIESNTIKIIDFGLATRFTKDTMLATSAGTPYYVAPEVLRKRYDELCDMWSCGVIMYVLLSGEVPFPGDSNAKIIQRVSLGKFKFSAKVWTMISEDAKGLISKLLVPAPDRLTAEQSLEHSWFSLRAATKEDIADKGSLIDHMKQFQASNKFRKAALQIIANQMDDTTGNSLRQIFEALDENGDGLLTLPELKSGLEKAGMDEVPLDMQGLMNSIDEDGSGVIDYTEFLSAALTPEQYEKEDILWSAFRRFDRDGSGKISRDELLAVLNRRTSLENGSADSSMAKTLADIFEAVDKDGDGEIDFDEFKDMMCSSAVP